MALWGHKDGTENKPNWLSAAEKEKTQATASGWELSTVVGSRTRKEVLVSINGLNTLLAGANITSFLWTTTTVDKSEGFTLGLTATFNEAVDVTGSPTFTVVNDQRANHVLTYLSGSGSNEIKFALAIAADNAATNAGDVLSVGANPIALAGGTIKDAGTSVVSTITSVASIGTAAGTKTVVA